MFRSGKKKIQSRIDSLIGKGTKIEGGVSFTGGLRVDGEVVGNVRSSDDQSGTLVVSEQARIEGEVHVPRCVINGTVVGPVHATEFLELQPGARVTGDVHYNNLEMHLGSVVQGRLMHPQTGASAVVAGLKLASSN